MVTVGIDVDSSARALALAHLDDDVFASVGVHPNEADDWDEASASRVAAMLSDERVVAVGESGLDYYREGAARDRQDAAFRAHISFAKELDKALVIHTRASVGAALDVVEKEGPPDRIVWHCWSGDGDDLTRALDMGSYVSFAGNVSFKNADRLKALASLVPEDRILVETDAPFLSPAPHRGTPNEPARVALVGDVVARVRGETAEAVARCTTGNARRLFSLHR